MPYLKYVHENFYEYAFDKNRVIINIALTLSLLSHGDFTIPQITSFLKEQRITEIIGDTYAVIYRLERWNYVRRVRDKEKYKTKIEFCCITEEGKELLSHMPQHLSDLIDAFHRANEYLKCN